MGPVMVTNGVQVEFELECATNGKEDWRRVSRHASMSDLREMYDRMLGRPESAAMDYRVVRVEIKRIPGPRMTPCMELAGGARA